MSIFFECSRIPIIYINSSHKLVDVWRSGPLIFQKVHQKLFVNDSNWYHLLSRNQNVFVPTLCLIYPKKCLFRFPEIKLFVSPKKILFTRPETRLSQNYVCLYQMKFVLSQKSVLSEKLKFFWSTIDLEKKFYFTIYVPLETTVSNYLSKKPQ